MPLEAGRTLGPYEIRERIGVGGMGEVYEAYDTRLRRSVAVKIVRDANTSSADHARLEREAQAAAALSHPNIVSVFDVGNANGVFYVVTELLQGHTLRDELKSGPIAPEKTIEYTREAAVALQNAHARGIVHRDIKPENVFITSDGRLKVLDFGLARLVATPDVTTAVQTPSLTADNVVVGTAAYMSPEQLRGEPAGPRSDIFSLGCVLYEMLTGQPPFLRNTQPATFAAILKENPPLSGIPARLVRILQRCMAKDPAARYPSAEALAADLDTKPARQWWPIAVPAALLIALVAVILFMPRRHEARPPAPARAPRRAMLAVLPFENLADPSQEYFADGLTEETTTQFGRVSPAQLGVIARTSTERFKGSRTDARTIGRELGVDYLVAGSVRRAGDRVRVAAELVRASDGTQVWADTYDRTLNDVLTLESELARDVANAVQIKVMPQRLATQTGPRNEEARDLLLRGRYFRSLGGSNLRKAEDAFQRALAIEPDSPELMTALASTYVEMSTREAAPNEVMPKARALAEHALQLDNSLAEAHAALSTILLEYYWQWAQAEREAKTAIALDPNLAAAYTAYAELLVCSGRTAEALQAQERANVLDPLSGVQAARDLLILFGAHDWDGAIREARRAIQVEPDFGYGYAVMALAEIEKGDTKDALLDADKSLRLTDSGFSMSLAAYVYAKDGRPDEARALVQKLEQRSQHEFICFFNVGAVYGALGDTRKAFASLERGYNDHTG